MRVSFPVSNSTLLRSDISSGHSTFDMAIGGSAECKSNMESLIAHGESVYQFGGTVELPGAHSFAFGMESFKALHAKGRAMEGVVIQPRPEMVSLDLFDWEWCSEYLEAAKDPRVGVIAIGCGDDEFSRIKFIAALIRKLKFSMHKSHWLYGFYNPAEISAYRSIYSSFIFSKFEMAVCSTCFVYSVYTVMFNPSIGVQQFIPGVSSDRRADLGMSTWMNYEMCRDQLRILNSNAEVVIGYAKGLLVADRYIDRLDLQGMKI